MNCSCESDTGYLGPCHGEQPDFAVCFHCTAPLDTAFCVEAIGELFCGTLCATLVARYDHNETCCTTGHLLTLPPAPPVKASRIVEMASCFACGRDLSRPWAVVKVRGIAEPVPVCSDPCIDAACKGERARINCEHCSEPTTPDDRLPTAAGGVSCSACRLRLSNAHGGEVLAKMKALGVGVMKGGRA